MVSRLIIDSPILIDSSIDLEASIDVEAFPRRADWCSLEAEAASRLADSGAAFFPKGDRLIP